ncbi:MAG: hypothetical protein KKC29_12940 [Alphaproteobacteria bacterium]|jgi:hypothetical protein|nr:hypothetical protein [Alphaproteobacteria bacterium]MBU2042120.1 hypothetical protein [Alphaproteobacteria bacterium]MBU2127272.1 hypothetical protein [Alphaproteobacteria bacterium]MBU2209317.1 hypothetical protein [Alphaproteobacteria bacterium]MBU2291997.1 hypothetical protein [Alphaproteobacteria bacterium]
MKSPVGKLVYSVMIGWAFTFVGLDRSYAQQNQLQNGDFEATVGANPGNNISHNISPWVLGAGNASNPVRVDGPGGHVYTMDAPQIDASNPAPGTWRHYLDIANGANDFYQTFTPSCSGQVRFGGWFSTRSNTRGEAKVTIVEGVGTGGTLVADHAVSVEVITSSREDPWVKVEHVANLNQNMTYSFVVSMDNNMNFDEGFVVFETGPCSGGSEGSDGWVVYRPICCRSTNLGASRGAAGDRRH